MKMRILKFTIFCMSILFFGQVNGQTVTEMTLPMSQGSKNALVLKFPKTDAKEVEKTWTKYLKDYDGKTKKNKKTGELFTDNALIEAMSQNTVDIYTQVKPQKGGGTHLIVWFDLGGAYLASQTHAAQYAVANKMLQKYANTISVTIAEDVVKEEEKALKEADDKLSKLDKTEADMKKDIADYQAKIKELEAEIKKNQAKRQAQAKVVEEQRAKTEKAKKALKDVKK